jgi:capsular exopolysaccharide synthesis family protein
MEQNPHEDNRSRSLERAPVGAPLALPESTIPAGQGPGRYAEQGNGQEPEVGLLEYWRILRRRKGTVLAIACAGLLAGFLVTLPQTPVYQARTSIEIQDLNQDFMNMRQVSPVSESSTYTALSDIQTQIKILQSDTLAERTIAKVRPTLTDVSKAPPLRANIIRSMFNLPAPSAADLQNAQLKALPGGMKVRAAGQTRIIEILVDSTDPKLAAAFANTLCNEFIVQNMEARWQMSQRTGDWLSRQLDDMRIKLERSDDALQSYARQAGLMFTSGSDNSGNNNGGSVSEQKLRQLQEELSKAQADRMTQESRYELTRNAAPETLPDVLNDSNMREFQSKLTDLERQKAQLTSVFKPEYTKVRQIQAQITTIEAALASSRNDVLGRVKNDFDAASRRERLLAAAYNTQVQLVTQESQKAIQYNILKREVESNRQLYEAMLQRVKESGIASAMKASNVRVVDEAKAPKKPYSPSLPMNAGLGLLAGAFLGMAFVVMRERADKTLQQPGEVALWLEVPELGVIPSANAARHRLYYYSPSKDGGEKNRKALTAGGDDKTAGSSVELITMSERPSMTAEAFRVVLTSILFSGENGSRPRAVVVTSPGPGEGKTTVATNLAISMAEIGRRVLLVDADLRRPRIHTLFKLPNEAGLTTLLQSTNLENADIASLIHPTPVASLFAMPSGPSTSAAANLLFSPVMRLLLQRFRNEFDMVIVDTPPSLQMPDARVVAREADAVVLVFRSGRTTRDAALATAQRFAEDKTRILGTILNDWNPSTAPNGYYGYYKGYYAGKYKGY